MHLRTCSIRHSLEDVKDKRPNFLGCEPREKRALIGPFHELVYLFVSWHFMQCTIDNRGRRMKQGRDFEDIGKEDKPR
jgi:hypothetical protein